MRLLLIMLLFAPVLSALDLSEIDAVSLRHARAALLKDDVRRHFGLRIGSFESLDQAKSCKLGDVHIVVLRKGERAAAVAIRDNAAGEHHFFTVEGRIECGVSGALLVAHCRVTEGGPQRARVLRQAAGEIQLVLSFLSEEREVLDGGRYVIRTRRELDGNGSKLVQTTTFMLDGQPVQGGIATVAWTLKDEGAALGLHAPEESAISIATHCALARRLERDRLNEAALRHAQFAKARALAENLAEDDARLLDALALVARLQTRVRRAEVSK